MAVPEFTSQESKEALRLIALLNGSLQFIASRLEELSKSKILTPAYINHLKATTQEVQSAIDKKEVK